VHFLDCDVEAPNGALLLRPLIASVEPVMRTAPQVDLSKCDRCGKCSEACRFHAIATAGNSVLVFPELCRGCGGCARICPNGAITEMSRSIGEIAEGAAGAIRCTQGALNPGEIATVHLIRAVRRRESASGIAILDSPPGANCPVAAAVEGADLVALVAEPTPFGLNDLRLVVQMVRNLGLGARIRVVINRDGVGDDSVERFCAAAGIPVIARIADERAVAEAYSRGDLPLCISPTFRAAIEQIAHCVTGGAPA
jgi:MinD superfamily P-loop ATPase